MKKTDSLTFNRRSLLETATAVTTLSALGNIVSVFDAHANGRAGPKRVREIENIWIEMSDGVKLAARAWIPEDAENNPVPALLEYIPYRKRDATRIYDEQMHPYFASHGYACFRVDIRGYGDSEGRPHDEYSVQEQKDGVETVDWLSRQPWCSGNVGAFGISWGGFSALQMAAKRPPALKAIITMCSTDDRFTDDAHYIGGCIVRDMFIWGSSWTTGSLGPPDPAIVGARWRDMWHARLKEIEFFVGDWIENHHRNEFWKNGSVNEDYSAIECAVYAVGGWIDTYSSAVPRMLENLNCPRKGLIGPWTHVPPNVAMPAPAIDWLTEALRWWDHWLKGEDTGVMDEPMYRIWMQHDVPQLGDGAVPGQWVAEDIWPSERINKKALFFNKHGLSHRQDAQETAHRMLSPQTVGETAPVWLPFDLATELPDDQRVDDGRSITFDSEPLEQDFEILGAPTVNLEFSVDKPVAFVAIRLNEVEPSGISKRVTYHIRNLTHRNNHEAPEALKPGKRYSVSIPLHDCAHRFKKDAKIRVAISTTYWPLIWPSPEPVELVVYAPSSSLELPIRPPRLEDRELRDLGEPFVPETSGVTVVERRGGDEVYGGDKEHSWNVKNQTLTIVGSGSGDLVRLNDTGTELASNWRDVSVINDDDPNSATFEIKRTEVYRRDGWDTRQESILKFASTKKHFLLEGIIMAFEDDEETFYKSWKRKIRRHLV